MSQCKKTNALALSATLKWHLVILNSPEVTEEREMLALTVWMQLRVILSPGYYALPSMRH